MSRTRQFGTRQHEVRGHYRSLRYEHGDVKKRVWVAQHQRGNPELGVITKDYVLTKGKDILYHIGSPENEISMIDLAKLVEKVCGKKDIVELVDPPIVYKHEPKRRCPSVDKIKKELDYTLDVPLEEALKRIFDWVKKNYK